MTLTPGKIAKWQRGPVCLCDSLRIRWGCTLGRYSRRRRLRLGLERNSYQAVNSTGCLQITVGWRIAVAGRLVAAETDCHHTTSTPAK